LASGKERKAWRKLISQDLEEREREERGGMKKRKKEGRRTGAWERFGKKA